MNDREKIIELVKNARDAELCLCQNCFDSDECLATGYCDKSLKAEAASLIANGVTIQKHGRWIIANGIIRCSECNAHVNYEMEQGQCFFPDESKYCHNCGAKMKEEKTVIDKEKIYVITKGDYSDYHIITATTDKELAEDIAAKYSSAGYYSERTRIEIFEDAEIMVLPAWRVKFDKTGALISCSYDGYDEYYSSGDIYKDRHDNLTVCLKVADETTAIKAAAEKRAMYIAREEGL